MPLPFLARLALLALTGAGLAAAEPRLLTRAIEVRSLSSAEAEARLPAQLRGVVVFIENASAVFLQDETSTTFFRLRTLPPDLRVGDEIEVRAVTRMGLYLPGLDYATIRTFGWRPLPPGIPVDYDDLVFGRHHYERVSVEGIVRSVRPLDRARTVIRLALGSRVIDVRVEAPPPAETLVDHRIRATGLAAGLINAPRRQLVQPYVRVIDWKDVVSLAAGAPAAVAPLISARELLAFDVRGLGERRVRIAGTVTAAFSDEHVYLQHDHMPFAARLARPAPLKPGDRVTLAGFPSMESFSASVVDAELLTQEPGPAPAPLPVASLDELYGPGDPLSGKYDGHLVQLACTVRDAFRHESGTTLIVQHGSRTVQARIPELANIPPIGALIRFTGICQVETSAFAPGFQGRPGLISLRAAAPADIVVLRRPGWWTPRRLGTGLAALAAAVILAGLWIAALRRQVARQTAALAAHIRAQAALGERQRIARDFHDTLEQELAGVSLRLDALASRPLDDKGRDLTAAARNLVTRIQTETRDLICDLRDDAENAGDLAAALAAVAERHATDSGADIRFEAAAAAPTLPAAVVHDLRMIARESVTNALRHGRATHVRITLEPSPRRLHLRITDNGCGFDPISAADDRRGHFGCAGIRERCRKVDAEVSWRSELQRGATVEITLPLPAATMETPPPRSAASNATPAVPLAKLGTE